MNKDELRDKIKQILVDSLAKFIPEMGNVERKIFFCSLDASIREILSVLPAPLEELAEWEGVGKLHNSWGEACWDLDGGVGEKTIPLSEFAGKTVRVKISEVKG